MERTIEIDGQPHQVADLECDTCSDSFPVPCEDCPGLKHAAFGDENYDRYWLYYRCDVCGDVNEPSI